MRKVLIVMLAVFMMSTAIYAETEIGVRGGVALGFHQLEEDLPEGASQEEGYINPDVALLVAFGLTDNIAIQVELNFMINQGVKVAGNMDLASYSAEYTYTSLDIPVLFRYTFDFGFGFFGGPHISIPLGKMKIESKTSFIGLSISNSDEVDIGDPTIGLTAGILYGLPVGPGKILFDLRFIFDFTKVQIKDEGNTENLATRRALAFTVGYAFSF